MVGCLLVQLIGFGGPEAAACCASWYSFPFAKPTILSCSPFLGCRNGSKASLGVLGWVCFGYDLCYHFGYWWGFAEVFDLIIVFGIVEGWPLWRSH